ncbi:hypothetical protein GLOTRDRAFT_127205 [Gloeophyllum trabeum ATCC 11539]|uniref:Fungal-type protein kinase domain-containing protein n=1 Tax=Gloeophyllum trabeum (strain ATCC 11539 / FP-39264 / Madison 617) TaxID=670483 RepID=S7RUD3_GLOTA|nr:uncharacterized protein GLOTRDRAFT_127205 [Gloeophyllum trabeum ATCC 11539]EPQ56804.1 hypothetical protein GLOTRDRAFT_127205 [Gloeophyllum trabeum ATCC 11539]
MSDSPPPTPSDAPISPSLDSSRPPTPYDVSAFGPSRSPTPYDGSTSYPFGVCHRAQWTVTGRTQHETVKRSKGFHSSLYGSEAGEQLLGALKMDAFLSVCFPYTDSDDRFSTFNATRMKELQELLGKVEPGGMYNVERPMYEPIRKALQYILNVFKVDKGLHSLAVYDTSRAYERGDAKLGQIAPDLMIQAGEETREKEPWSHALGIIEVKPERKEDPTWNNDARRDMNKRKTKTWDQIQEYGAVAFQARPRCYLLGMGFYDDIARFYRWDRSAVILSEAFDYKTDCQPLVEFLYGFATYGNNTMGTDSTIKCSKPLPIPLPGLQRLYDKAVENGVVDPKTEVERADLCSHAFEILAPAGEPSPVLGDISPSRRSKTTASAGTTRPEPETYVTLGDPLFSARSLFGRGTRTWLATSVAASRPHFSPGKEMEQCVIIKDSWREEDRLTEKVIYERIHEKGHIFGVARCRGGFDVGSVSDVEEKPCHETCASRVNPHLPKDKDEYRQRIHYRCVLESVGIPLTRFRSTRELVAAVRDVVKGLNEMTARGILHRDISVNNILISACPSAEHGAIGFLIDPEYAAFLTDKNATSVLRRITGTIQFISIQFQHGDKVVEHKAWHDLESVYWVLLYTVICHADTNITSQQVRRIFDEERGSGKVDWIWQYEWEKVEVIGHWPLTVCLREFGRLVASHHLPDQPRNASKLLNHFRVLRALDRALASPIWPEEDPGAREFKQSPDEIAQMNEETAKNVSSAIRSSQASGMSDAITSDASKQSASRKRKAREGKEEDQPQPSSSGTKRIRSES